MAYTEIDRPDLYFNTVLYTGNGSTQSISGVNFSPDWVWIKQRDGATARHHRLVDSVRGATKYLESDRNIAEVTDSNQVTSLDSDGFTVGTGNATNSNTVNFASWNWLGGGTASSNTDGSITSSVSANTTSGFSIVSYTGTGANATVGHGLGSAPKMVITKSRDTTGLDWRTYHASLGATQFVVLNLTDASSTASNFMNNTEPTSSVFSLGSGTTPNKSGDAYIAYCFAEKKGFSKFGSGTGSGTASTNFIYLGFKPAFVMIKRTDSTDSWAIFDNQRPSYNVTPNRLFADLSNAESTSSSNQIDMVSNGFVARGTSMTWNASGSSFIYMAFAESPFTTSTGVPTTAR